MPLGPPAVPMEGLTDLLPGLPDNRFDNGSISDFLPKTSISSSMQARVPVRLLRAHHGAPIEKTCSINNGPVSTLAQVFQILLAISCNIPGAFQESPN